MSITAKTIHYSFKKYFNLKKFFLFKKALVNGLIFKTNVKFRITSTA